MKIDATLFLTGIGIIIGMISIIYVILDSFGSQIKNELKQLDVTLEYIRKKIIRIEHQVQRIENKITHIEQHYSILDKEE